MAADAITLAALCAAYRYITQPARTTSVPGGTLAKTEHLIGARDYDALTKQIRDAIRAAGGQP